MYTHLYISVFNMCIVALAPHSLRRERQAGGVFFFPLQGFFCVCSYGPSLLNVSCWMGEALYQKQPFIRRRARQLASDLCSNNAASSRPTT